MAFSFLRKVSLQGSLAPNGLHQASVSPSFIFKNLWRRSKQSIFSPDQPVGEHGLSSTEILVHCLLGQGFSEFMWMQITCGSC